MKIIYVQWFRLFLALPLDEEDNCFIVWGTYHEDFTFLDTSKVHVFDGIYDLIAFGFIYHAKITLVTDMI
jgi:hypothetical protein